MTKTIKGDITQKCLYCDKKEGIKKIILPEGDFYFCKDCQPECSVCKKTLELNDASDFVSDDGDYWCISCRSKIVKKNSKGERD